MVSNLEAIGISCVASFIVLLVIGVGKVVWTWFLSDIWLKWTCRHVIDVSGEWYWTRADQSDKHEYFIKMRQYGWRLRGSMNYSISRVEKDPINKNFEFEGIIRGEFMSVYYWNEDRKQKGIGGYTLEVVKNGDELKGKGAFYATNSREGAPEILNQEAIWTRRK